MRISKFLVLIFLVAIGFYVWHHYFRAAPSEADVSETGFVKVVWLEGAEKDEVIVIGPS
jgi:hypothetical protein